MTNTYLDKIYIHILDLICVHVLDLPFLKYNETAIFLFENIYNKKRSPFLFERDIFCYVWGSFT